MKDGFDLPSVFETPGLFLWLIAVGSLGAFNASVSASTIIGSPDFALFQAAVEAGGVVTLQFDDTVSVFQTLTIKSDTTIDASGHHVVIDGRSQLRHFMLTNGATLRLVNVTVANGRFKGRDGEDSPAVEAGLGGAVYCPDGKLELLGCTFTNNASIGGGLSPGNRGGTGGDAFGGAIYLVSGRKPKISA